MVWDTKCSFGRSFLFAFHLALFVVRVHYSLVLASQNVLKKEKKARGMNVSNGGRKHQFRYLTDIPETASWFLGP